MKILVAFLLAGASLLPVSGQLVISGNENKIDLTSGLPRAVAQPKPDSVTILDFKTFPPAVQHIEDVPNSVIGPPSNIAITPDRSLALLANSIKIDPGNPTNTPPESYVHVIDLRSTPPKVLSRVQTDQQPSGLSISPDGRWALVANRASGAISVLSIRGTEVALTESVKVCEPKDSISDVAISPSGSVVLASIQKAGYLALLHFENGKLELTSRKISVSGQPYRCVITPDGQLGITAGQGFGNGPDVDAVSVIDLAARPIHTVDLIPVGMVPESLEISPDGKLLAVTVMNGSNLAESNPNHARNGAVVLLGRRGKTFHKLDEYKVGRIPEGVAFTSDGKYMVVQCHPDRQLWIFSVRGERLKDTGERIALPGMPASLRASR